MNVADIREGNGKTIRENNLEREHKHPIGSLVEVVDNGLCLWVHSYSRDCDGEPLYNLTFNQSLIGNDTRVDIKELLQEIVKDQDADELGLSDNSVAVICCHKAFKKEGQVLWDYCGEDSLKLIHVA